MYPYLYTYVYMHTCIDGHKGGKKHVQLGFCDGVDAELNSADLNYGQPWDWGSCWAACLLKYPDNLVAIDGPGMLFWRVVVLQIVFPGLMGLLS